MFSAFAQDATPTFTTSPENPSETDDVTLVVRGFFPNTDYAVSSTVLGPRYTVSPAAAHGANEFEYNVTIRYTYGPAGGQALTPYEVRFFLGHFPRFARIRAAVAFVPENTTIAPSAWFAKNTFVGYVYVRNPEPPRLEAQPAAPLSTDAVRVTMRWYYTGYYASRITHEFQGRVIRIKQDVVYVGPDESMHQTSEGQVTHDLGRVPAGNWQVEWHQTVSGQNEGIVAAMPLTVVSNGGSCTCGSTRLSIETTNLAFDGFPLGAQAGPQTISLMPQPALFGIDPPPPQPAVALERIWVNNLDFITTHDCRMKPATMAVGSTCTLTVFYNGTLHGANAGALFVRFSSFDGVHTVSVPLTGRTLGARGINFIPPPVTPDTAIEYYAPALDHYFFTSAPAEQQIVDAGIAGDWRRTGVTFPVGGPADVCRFYGDRSGPNSHFYTGNTAECQSLRAIDAATPLGTPAWRYEGIALKAEVPAPDPSTPLLRPYCVEENARMPIYRLYNDGADKRIDSNHRHVPSRGTFPSGKTGEDIVRDMMAAGWIYEGNALCN